MSNKCGLCSNEIAPGTPHYSTMEDDRYIDVCARCAGAAFGFGVPPTPAPQNKPIPANLVDNAATKLPIVQATEGKEGAMSKDTPEPQTEVRILTISTPGKYGKEYRLEDGKGGAIELSGRKEAMRLGHHLLKIAKEK